MHTETRNAKHIAASKRLREFRERQRLGLVCAQSVELYLGEVAQLVATGWLRESERHDRVAIGRALSEMIEFEFGPNGRRPFPSKPS